MEAEKKPFIVKLGPGVEVDLAGLPPMTIGDKRALKAAGVDFVAFVRAFQGQKIDPDDEAKIVLFTLRKRRAETTPEEVDGVPAITSMQIVSHILQRAMEVDDPFSISSTSSEQPTVGASSSSGAAPTLNSPA